jgi:glutathione S-transferase
LFPIAFYLQRFPESKAMVQSQKHLTGFIERMLARPSVKATTPPPPPKKD